MNWEKVGLVCGAVTSCNPVVLLSDQGMGGEIKVEGFVVTGDSLVVVTCLCLHVLELAHFCSRLERKALHLIRRVEWFREGLAACQYRGRGKSLSFW